MDSSKEKIEAQLCAYVEGELDEADRADIERHLQTNPQHKALIAELRRHRDLLQTLPRATIPGDLNENLTGQLERSALLSDDDETAEAGVRINRWPQFAAIAAVLVLAVGLGLVVFYVLPAGTKRSPVASMADKADNATARRAPAASEPAPGDLFAEKPSPATTRPTLGRDDTLASATSLDGMTRGRAPSADLPAAPPPAAAPMVANENKSAASGALGPAADQKTLLRELTTGTNLVTPGEVEELQRRMTRTLGGEANTAFHLDPRNSLYLVVRTNDPTAANGQVTAYFKTNNIQYMNAAADVIDVGAKPVAVAQVQDTDKAAELRPGTGAYGGGLSTTLSRLEARGFEPGQPTGGGQFGAGGGSGGFGGGARSGGASAGAEAKAGLADANTTYGRTTPAESARRGVAREPGAPAAAAAAAASQPYVALSGSRNATLPLGSARSADAESPVKQKTKLDGSAAPGERAAETAPIKDALSLNTPAQSAPAEPPAQREALGAGVTAQAGQQPAVGGRNRSMASAGVGGAPTWEMRGAAIQPSGERGATPGGVIVARMNRRQATELGSLLSHDQGQRAELRDFAGFNDTLAGVPVTTPAPVALGDATADRAKTPAPTAAAGKPSTPDRGEAVKKESAQNAPADETLRLNAKAQDEPVDVVIVLKPAATATPPAAAAKPDGDSKK